ncbi:MAG: arsenate reductase ArsC [Spirochaetales bacterium]|nr:arsenate reductase ArsC [Spirochaetales bacterium]
MKKNILFLCTGNSCRSQMAEGWMRELHGDEYNVYSAGIETHGLNPNAVRVMAEAGVDISGHKSTLASDFRDIDFDAVITVCGHADENCPVWLGKTNRIHHGFDDPPRLAADIEDPEKKLEPYRRVRDEIREYLKEFSL